MVLSCETFYRKFFPKLLLAVQTAAASYQHYQLMPLGMAFFAAQNWDQVLLDLTAWQSHWMSTIVYLFLVCHNNISRTMVLLFICVMNVSVAALITVTSFTDWFFSLFLLAISMALTFYWAWQPTSVQYVPKRFRGINGIKFQALKIACQISAPWSQLWNRLNAFSARLLRLIYRPHSSTPNTAHQSKDTGKLPDDDDGIPYS